MLVASETYLRRVTTLNFLLGRTTNNENKLNCAGVESCG